MLVRARKVSVTLFQKLKKAAKWTDFHFGIVWRKLEQVVTAAAKDPEVEHSH